MGELNEPVLDLDVERPRTRGDCQVGGPKYLRPCPFISCRHHLAGPHQGAKGQLRVLDTVIPIACNAPDAEAAIEEAAEAVVGMQESCALDVVDRQRCDESTLEEVGAAFGVTRERVRQIQSKATRGLNRTSVRRRLR